MSLVSAVKGKVEEEEKGIPIYRQTRLHKKSALLDLHKQFEFLFA